MTAGITEILTDGSTGQWCVVLQGSRISGCSGNHDGVIQRTVLTQGVHDSGYG